MKLKHILEEKFPNMFSRGMMFYVVNSLAIRQNTASLAARGGHNHEAVRGFLGFRLHIEEG